MFGFSKNSKKLPLTIFKPNSLSLLNLETFLANTLSEKYNVKNHGDYFEIRTNIKYKKLVVKTYDSYIIIGSNTQYSITLNAVDIEEKSENPKTLSEKDSVIKKILDFSNSHLDSLQSFTNNDNNFIDAKNILQQNSVLSLLKTNEFIIAYLPIGNLKTNLIPVNKKENYYLLLTSKRKLIIPFKITVECEILDFSQHDFTYKSKTGKDHIYNEYASFYTEFFNDSLFEELKEFITKKAPNSLELFADILVNRSKLKTLEINSIKNIYETNYLQNKNLTTLIKKILITTFTKKKFDKDKLNIATFFDLTSKPNFETALNQVFLDWKIDLAQKEKFLNFLLSHKGSYNISTIAAFYTSVVNLKSSNEKEVNLTFKVSYAKFLNEAKLFTAAIPQYDSIIDSLKNQSVLEMLSDNKADILNSTHASALLIELLDELVAIKKVTHQNYDAELLKLAELQPLNSERIKDLKQVNNPIIKKKADVILHILEQLDFALNKDKFEPIQQIYTKDEIFENIVPKSYENAKGFFDTITNLIAQIEPPDYKNVTDFSDKITSESNPQIFNIIDNIAKALSIEPIEYFLGRGNFSEAIIGVENKTNFLIIGNSYLDKQSELFMSKTELQFAVTIELSHILFEHTRITSQDVWRGAKNKSMSLAQVLLVALPALGTISGLLGRFVDLTRFKRILTGVDTVSDTIDKGQTVIDYGSKITDFFSKNDDNEQNLLATSRLMEISADRVGLLITKDLTSAVSSMFKLDSDFENIKKSITKNGLYSFLTQKNDEEEFIRQNYIIRLKTLFSFYLQTEFV